MDKYYLYDTVDGDTFDSISLSFYGTEYNASEIMAANTDYVGYLIFPAGIGLRIPVIDTPAASSLPPWKRQ